MKCRFLWQGAVAAALLAAVAGCSNSSGGNGGSASTSGTSSSSKPTYMLITNGTSPFWVSLDKGSKEVGSTLKVDAERQSPNPSNTVQQIRIFKDALAKGVKGIGISVIDPAAMTPTINQAVASHVPVICFDSDAPDSNRLAYLGTNNFNAGFLAGQAARKLFPNGGKLMAFVGTMSQQNAIDRYNGFLKALQGSNITFLAPPMIDNQDKNVAQTNIQNAITKYQSQGLNGLVGLYSYDGPAIINVVQQENLRSKMKIICFDGDPETLKGLADGMVDLTVVQSPYQEGRLSIMLLNYLNQDKGNVNQALQQLKPELDKLKMPLNMQNHTIDTGVTVVTPANAPAFLQMLKEKGIAST